MTPSEAGRLLAHCAAFDNRQPSAVANKAWSYALYDIPFDEDVFRAVARFYGTPPANPGERLWIQPHDVRAGRSAMRAQRLVNFVYQPPPGGADPDFLSRYRQQMESVASGRVAGPDMAPVLVGGPHQSGVNELAGVGREVPAAGSLISAVRRSGPLGQSCPVCKAPVGRACRRRVLGRKRPHPHEIRRENARRAAVGLVPLTLADWERAEQTSMAKRRAASRQAFARYQASEEAAPPERGMS